jgi:hypothetical protein
VLAALDREGRPVEQDAVADRDPEIFALEDGAAAARRLEELEPELPCLPCQQVDLGRSLRALLLVALDLAHLHLRFAGHLLRGCAEARDEALEPLDVCGDPAGSFRRRLQPRGLLDPPLVPRTGEVRRTSRFELEHGVRNRLEEPAVVRNDDDACVERLQLALEPLEALHVEVVRRLVEQQQVGVAPERARQGRPSQLTTRERLEPAVEMFVTEAEAAQDSGCALAPVVATGVLEPRLCLAVAAHRRVRVVSVCHRALEPPELVLQRQQVGRTRQHVLAECQVALERRALVVQRDPGPLLECELAAFQARLADEGSQQRRFPGAVRPG